MPSTTSSSRIRRWAYPSMVAAVAAGAVCTGVGVGSAATTVSADFGAETSGPADMRVSNATGHTIDVWVKKTKGRKVVGELFANDLAANAQVYGRMDDDTVTNVTEMSVCLDHAFYHSSWETTGHKWDDLYVFAPNIDNPAMVPTVFVTGTGGGDNRTLESSYPFAQRC